MPSFKMKIENTTTSTTSNNNNNNNNNNNRTPTPTTNTQHRNYHPNPNPEATLGRCTGLGKFRLKPGGLAPEQISVLDSYLYLSHGYLHYVTLPIHIFIYWRTHTSYVLCSMQKQSCATALGLQLPAETVDVLNLSICVCNVCKYIYINMHMYIPVYLIKNHNVSFTYRHVFKKKFLFEIFQPFNNGCVSISYPPETTANTRLVTSKLTTFP